MTTIGIDVGGTSVRAGVVDGTGRVVATARGHTRSTEQALEDEICGVIARLRADHDVDAVGLAVAGFVAADRRTVMFAPHLPWRDVAVADRIAARIGLPVVLEHDANAAGVAEHRFGALAGSRVGLLIALGTGIGAALILDGEIYRGAHGVAPELGHLRLVPAGRTCPCGKRGCWERYCSGTALAAVAQDLAAGGTPTVLGSHPTGRTVAAAAREGDPVARAAVADLAAWLAEGLALAADAYDPDTIALGGGVSVSADLFLPEATSRLRDLLTGAGHRPYPVVRPATYPDHAGMIGAAVLAAALV
ncbi:ROK family protein [Actinokineospora inagensis]|uniref:ROK family protein n=1 Tax=Actinokineospora inagensis TaxID=103730 RepID=UPI0003F5C2E3|nr:ROK family protein [Actinokineospora inagensis]